MRVVHTSDWHLGRTLCGRRRYDEFAAFLDWLADLVDSRAADALLVVGDIFDGVAPTHRAQELYYGFLRRLSETACRDAVIVAGNHDSPSLLDAPRAVLGALRAWVVGAPAADPADDVRILRDAHDRPGALVCALPFLRERDLRVPEPGESVEDRDRRRREGLRRRHAESAARAIARRDELAAFSHRPLPILMTGHLFVAGGIVDEGDGVRDLHVGTLDAAPVDLFPPGIDYVALGHLHRAQSPGGDPRLQYCGAPLPLGFGDAGRGRVVLAVDFDDGAPPRVEPIPVPAFRRLARVRGDWPAIEARLAELRAESAAGWLEAIYEGAELLPDLRDRVAAALAGSGWEALRIKNERSAGLADPAAGQTGRGDEDEDEYDGETESALEATFEQCLQAQGVPEEQREELRQTHRMAVAALRVEFVKS